MTYTFIAYNTVVKLMLYSEGEHSFPTIGVLVVLSGFDKIKL